MLRIESQREADGRWLAEVPALPGVMSYGATEAEARAAATALARRVIADRQKNGVPLAATLLRQLDEVAKSLAIEALTKRG